MVLSYDPSHTGGVQEHLFFLSRAMTARGHHVDIYGPTGEVYSYKNYHQISKPWFLPSLGGNSINITTELNHGGKLIQKMDKKNYDLIHFHDPYIPFVNFEIIKNVDAPKVASFHSAWDDRSFFNAILPLLYLFKDEFSKHFRGVIFVSKLSASRWKHLSKRGVEKQIIYNGVDGGYFPGKKNNGTPTILCLSRLVSRKGGEYILRAMKKILAAIPKTKLVIVGKGPIKKKLVDYVKNNNLESHVVFAGEKFGKEKIKYYQSADVFCAPYTNEAFGLTFLEAMACGVPIVGFKNDVTKEILKNYPGRKFLVEPKNVQALATSIIEVLKNKKKREALSRWCLCESKKYSWSKNAAETEKFYYRVLNNHEKHS